MSQPVDSFRKHQKMIVIGFAITVIALYMIPFDQLAHAGPKADALKLRFQVIIDRLNGLGLTSVADHLTTVQTHVYNILASHGL